MALDFVAGCLGGCAGVAIGHPFDTVKVKLQTQDYKNPMYRGTWDCFTKILKAESVAGVYRGVSSPMVGVAVVNAIVFGVYGNIQRCMPDPDSLKSHFIAGAGAGLIQSLVASPVELVKTRVQLSSLYRSPWDCFIKTYQQDGVHGVFKGLSVTGVREFLGYGLYFATYEALTRTSAGDAPVGTVSMLLAGGLSGTVSWVFTYPMDVIKTRLQADIGKYSSIADCIKQSIRDEGLKCLTKGLTPTLIRAFPVNAVTFTVVSWVFRLADFGENKKEDLKDRIDSIIETLPQEANVLSNLELVGGTIGSFELNRTLMNQHPKYSITSEDPLNTNKNNDVLKKLIEPKPPTNGEEPHKTESESNIDQSSVGSKVIDCFLQQGSNNTKCDCAQINEQHKNVNR